MYAIALAAIVGGGLFAFQSYGKKEAPKKKVIKEKKVDRPSLVQTKSGGYEEEWIPESHLRSRKPKSAASSGDEAPTSPGRKQRKSRK